MAQPRSDPSFRLVGISGNWKRPSKTHALVATVLRAVEMRYRVGCRHLDLSHALPDLGLTFCRGATAGGLADVVSTIEGADALVVGTAVYKGSYAGLFKHLFDLIEPPALMDKPVIITAAGGGDRHALVVEQALRPLFGFFCAHTMPTAIYASARDFEDERLVGESVLARIDDAVTQIGPFITSGNKGTSSPGAATPAGVRQPAGSR